MTYRYRDHLRNRIISSLSSVQQSNVFATEITVHNDTSRAGSGINVAPNTASFSDRFSGHEPTPQLRRGSSSLGAELPSTTVYTSFTPSSTMAHQPIGDANNSTMTSVLGLYSSAYVSTKALCSLATVISAYRPVPLLLLNVSDSHTQNVCHTITARKNGTPVVPTKLSVASMRPYPTAPEPTCPPCSSESTCGPSRWSWELERSVHFILKRLRRCCWRGSAITRSFSI